MISVRHFIFLAGLLSALAAGAQPVPVNVAPVVMKRGMVIAGHPQAAEAGLAVLRSGGNAIDAAIATSLSLGVAEPYASGLGGKLVLLYYEADSGQIHVVEAMDAAGSINVPSYLQRPEAARNYGYTAVCVPGLAAGLWTAHQKWGSKPWAKDVEPAINLAQVGFRVLPKSRDLFEEQIKKLHRGDPEIARLYLPEGEPPASGLLLPNPDLARTLTLLAQQGRDGFYRGPVAEAIAAASAKGGGAITLDDLAGYTAHLTETVGIDFRSYRIESAPPPASGAAMFMPALKVLEEEAFGPGLLRTAANLDRIGRVWRVVESEACRAAGRAARARQRWSCSGASPSWRWACPGPPASPLRCSRSASTNSCSTAA